MHELGAEPGLQGWLGPLPGRRQVEMSVADRAAFEAIAGDLLAELGYET